MKAQPEIILNTSSLSYLTLGVSIIIPTYNRQSRLKCCIDSLINQKYDTFEIIVVDDASTDDTKKFLTHLYGTKVRIIGLASNSGAGAARNAGISVASMPLIAFIDDDCEAKEDWLRHLVLPFKNPCCGLVIGQTWYLNQYYSPTFPERIVHNHNAAWPMTCNMAYRRCVFEQLGGFSNEYSKYNNEDTEMAIRAIAAGWECSRTLEAEVSHQQNFWTTKSLLTSAKNPCAAILLKRDYPNHHEYFGKQLVAKYFLRPTDYLFIIGTLSTMPLLFLICIAFGHRGLLFFIYWCVRMIVRRVYVYKTAWKCKTFII